MNETTSPSNQWTALQGQWQALGQQWAQWWAKATNLSASGLPLAEFGNSSIVLPTLPATWIEPAAAAALTEKFKLKLDALWLQIMQGAPQDATKPHRDRRFATREWQEQPYFALLKGAYLFYAEYLRELAQLAEADAASKKRLEFIVRQYIDAIAPSNFLATNPDAIKLALESGGASLAQGLSNLAADAQRGRIAMTDESAFQVGVNLAVTPGSVIFRNDLIELIQYAPTTKQVFRRPLRDHPAVHQQVLYPRPSAGQFLRPLRRGPGTHRVHGFVAQHPPGARCAGLGRLPRGRRAHGDRSGARHHGEQNGQRARLLRRRHAARLRAGGARCAACKSGDERDVSDHDARFLRPRRHRRLHLARRARRAGADAAVGRARPGQRTGKRIREPARERTGLELRRRQLSQGSDSARIRPAVLERRFRESARAHVSRLRHAACIWTTGCASRAR